MIGFEWEFWSSERSDETTKQWWSRQPRLLKIAFVVAALPAWCVIVFNSLSGQPETLSSIIAFCVFGTATVAALIVERRHKASKFDG